MTKALVWRALLGDRRGVTSVEYALIGTLVFLVIVFAVSKLGSTLGNTFGGFANNL